MPQQQLIRTNSFTQATQNQPLPLNNLQVQGPISLGYSNPPQSIPLSSLPASPSAINATTVYYNPIHGNSHPNDASASIIFAARNGLNRKRVFSSPNQNNVIQKMANTVYNQNNNINGGHHRSGSCSSILSNSNTANINGSQIRNGPLTPSTDLVLRNQVQNEVLYNHIHQQPQNYFRRPKSHSPSTMQPYPPTSSPHPNPTLNGHHLHHHPMTTSSTDHCYDKIHNRQLSSSSAADDDAEYGYHSASSSSELERQQRRVQQQRPTVNGQCNGLAFSPQTGFSGKRPRSAGAVTRQQEYIRKVTSPNNQSIVHLQKNKTRRRTTSHGKRRGTDI